MDIKNIIRDYGISANYYEMNTGRIFHFTEYTYDSESNKSSIPVSCDGDYIGSITVDGDIKDIA